MSDSGFPYADIIILALIAGFVLLRLRAVLGQKSGFDQPSIAAYRPEPETPVVQVSAPVSAEAESAETKLIAAIADGAVRDGINAIKAADKDFTLSHFMDGAKAAFEMVFDAFTKDDRDTLKMLLSPELFSTFAAELDKRRAMETYPETTLLALVSQEVTGASLYKNTARIIIRHVSEQVSVVRDKQDKIVDGDPSHAQHVEDKWTFERDISSRSPNWKIIET